MTGIIPAIDPATGKTIGEFELTSRDNLKEIINKARTAQEGWAKLNIKDRVKAIRPVLRFLVDKADELTETISRDNGKTRVDALATEILPASMSLNYYLKHAKKFLKPISTGTGNLLLANKRSKIVRVPFGIIGIISPWNYPFGIPFSEVIMALLAGNAVILKTASETLAVGESLNKCMKTARIPDGLFNYVNMRGKEAGTAFLEEKIDKIFFTGSVPVGKWLMAKAAETLTPLVLELGGNDPMLVCPDADLFRATSGAIWGGLSNSGQSCAGVERVYVHTSVYDEFMRILTEKVKNIRGGYGLNWNSDMGVITTENQYNTIQKHIEDAVARGATIAAQSSIITDKSLQRFIPATVLTDVTHDMLVMKEETFGPVLGVMKIESMEEGIRLANDSILGLTASVWSKNHRKAIELGRQLKAGAISINDHLMTHGLAETPWGGFKESGIGRTHGRLGFDEMTQPQVIINDIMPFVKRNMWWHPYSENLYNGLKGIIDFLYGKGIQIRLRGLKRLIGILPRMFTKKP